MLKKWVVRWLTILYDSGLTLPSAEMLLDPNHPIYQQVLKLVADDLARFQMESLSFMKPSDQENEIGSARNRLLSLLSHPTTVAFLSRRDNTMDFYEIYDNDLSLIVNLDRGRVLTPEVQKMFANICLTKALEVVFGTPQEQRRRRICIVDELPVFIDTCGHLLEQCVTEIRKYKTSFVFAHQGANRFENRTENPLLLAMLDMCRVKVFFRHTIDAEFFGGIVSSAAGVEPVVKHRQINEQQFQDGYTILDLIDTNFSEGINESQTESESESVSQDASTAISTSLRKAVEQINQSTQTKTNAVSSGKQNSQARQVGTSRSTSTTYKQTAVANMVTKLVCTGVQYYTNEERDRGAMDLLYELATGEAVFFVDGLLKPVRAKTPLSGDPYGHAIKYGDKMVRRWIESVYSLPQYASPAQILIEFKQFNRLLIEALYRQSPVKNSFLGHEPSPLRVELLLPDEKDRPDNLGL